MLTSIKGFKPIEHYTGRHCCLYCEVSSEEMKKPLNQRRRSPSRTLDSLQRDYLQFSNQGGGNLKNAKHHNNVIASTLFNIPISQVYTYIYLAAKMVSKTHALGCTTRTPHITGDFYEIVATYGE